MARGKRDQSFTPSPFKSLKGLAISGPAPPRTPALPPAPTDAPPVARDERELFAREMSWLAVRPLAGRPSGDGEAAVLPPPPAVSAEDDEAEFLAAVGQLDKTFDEIVPDAGEPPRARPRRLKQLERGELKPAGELDLHGLARDEALARTSNFLAHAVRQKWPVVVIITGKGLHSAEGPVLYQAVVRLLASSRDKVLEWSQAPRRFGGAGALVVFLKVAQ